MWRCELVLSSFLCINSLSMFGYLLSRKCMRGFNPLCSDTVYIVLYAFRRSGHVQLLVGSALMVLELKS